MKTALGMYHWNTNSFRVDGVIKTDLASFCERKTALPTYYGTITALRTYRGW